MENVKKNKFLTGGVTLMVLLGLVVLVPLEHTVGAEDPSSQLEVTLIENEENQIVLTYHITGFTKTPVEINGETYQHLSLGTESTTVEPGEPEIPTVSRSIIIPDDQQMNVQVTGYTYEDHTDILIAPSKGLLCHNMDPADVPYIFGPLYDIDAWYPGPLTTAYDPYILRDFRGQSIQVNPFQYNPVTHTLRVYTSITLEITPLGRGGTNILDRDDPGAPLSSDFRLIYERHFLNFDEGGTRYTPVDEVGNMLIICYDSFYATMVPFVTWKNMKGIPTEIVNVSTIGDANAIKTYISNYYATNGLTFVLLVGDINEIPTLYSYGSASDPSYTYVVGSDHYPDLFIGRFSAQDTSQLQTQVERSIDYEKNPLVGGDWYHKGVGIASSQGAGVGDEGEADWQHMRNIRTKLMAYTYTEVDEFYDGSQGGDDAGGNPTSSMVSTAVNDGRSIINYCGHGSPSSWSTSGFSNSNINALTNDNMLPFVTCVACNNGEFDTYSSCFAETWMRATNSGTGEPTGAIGVYASTQSQSWAPPMDAQDEINDILVELYPTNIKRSLGGLCYNGAMHMIDNYPSALDEIDTWTFFGDPSLQIRTDTPASMTVIHSSTIPDGATSFEVTVTGLENALCALSQNGELLGHNYTDATGYAYLTLTSPVSGPTPLDLVVTAYNKIPYNATVFTGDDSPPSITNIAHTPLGQLMGGYVNVSCVVTDIGGVDTVMLSITDPEGGAFDVSMLRRGSTDTYYYNTTYGIPGEYQVTIWANDTAGNANTATGYTFSVHLIHTFTFVEGWNLITVPVEGYTAETFSTALGNCSIVTRFDVQTETFISHICGVPWDDFPLEPGIGYFIYMTSNTTGEVTGLPLTYTPVQLYATWNLIGWYQGYSTFADALASAIPGTTVVTMYDAVNQEFDSYIVTKGTTTWGNYVVNRGMGIFLYTTQASVWDGTT